MENENNILKNLTKFINNEIQQGISENSQGLISAYDKMIYDFINYELIIEIERVEGLLENISLEKESVLRIQMETRLYTLKTILEHLIDYIEDFEVSENLKQSIQIFKEKLNVK